MKIKVQLVFLPVMLILAGCTSMENKYSNSKNFKDGKFVNGTTTNIGVPGKFWETIFTWIFSGDKEKYSRLAPAGSEIKKFRF